MQTKCRTEEIFLHAADNKNQYSALWDNYFLCTYFLSNRTTGFFLPKKPIDLVQKSVSGVYYLQSNTINLLVTLPGAVFS